MHTNYFKQKNGLGPINIDYLVIDKQLSKQPPVPPEISTTGWELWTYQKQDIYSATPFTVTADQNVSLDIARGTNNNDIAFALLLDGNGTSKSDKLDYCNIINNTGLRTWSMDSNISLYTGIAASDNPFYFYDDGITDGNVSQDMFCYADDIATADGNLTIIVVVDVDTVN